MTGRTAAVGARPCSRKRRSSATWRRNKEGLGARQARSCLQVTLELAQPLDGARLTHSAATSKRPGLTAFPVRATRVAWMRAPAFTPRVSATCRKLASLVATSNVASCSYASASAAMCAASPAVPRCFSTAEGS